MHALLLLAVLADVRLEHVRESLTGTHCRYREYVDGFPTDQYVTMPCGSAAAASIESKGRPYRREIREESPLQPWAYDYDPHTGEFIRRVPLFFNGKPARVFDPNPVASENDPTLQDRNDSATAVPESAYHDVELDDVAPSGPLHGPHVTMVDRQAPNVAPPDGSASLRFDRNADGFEDVNAYFHIDRNQRYLQSLGYTGARQIVPYAIEVDAHAASSADNSFFIPSSTTPGRGTLYFGEGGTDDAEDADLVVHEYGHAILEWIAPGTFSGSFTSESRALSEGFGDYWAFSAHYLQRLNSGRDPSCFADWDARCWLDDVSQQCAYPPDTDCLRRVDSPATMADYDFGDTAGVEHRNGQIWSSALHDIQLAIGTDSGQIEGRRIADTIVIESLFDAPPHPTFAVMARRLLEADRRLYGGAYSATICSAMSGRGILTDCSLVPRGEITAFQSPQHAIAIPENNPNGIISTLVVNDTRAIARVRVRVDIAHTARGDLRIDLVAPDGTTVMLQNVSFERSRDIHVTFGYDAVPAQSLDILNGRSAAGEWRLIVRDLRALDTGTLLSWGLEIQFEGDQASATRPRGTFPQMIPVAAHVGGANGTAFVTDVRIANPTEERDTIAVVFTRDGEDGNTNFAALNVVAEPGETLAFDDVVDSLFHTTGAGSLEVIGGTSLVVMSRTYTSSSRGTFGQQVPANLDTTRLSQPSLFVAPFTGAEDTRVNFGVTETVGAEGTVRVTVGSDENDFHIAPFSHFQFPVEAKTVEVSVVEGEAVVEAYLSQVDNGSGDAMFIPAQRLSDQPLSAIVPVITTPAWRSDLVLSSPGAQDILPVTLIDSTHGDSVSTDTPTPHRHEIKTYIDVVKRLFARENVLGAMTAQFPGNVVGATRVATDGMTQYVPFMSGFGDPFQTLVFIESSNAFRTNVGIVSEHGAVAQVVVYDSAGTEKERFTLATGGGIAQDAVRTRVVGGRAVVHFTQGEGSAYASLVDNGTRDATFIEGR